jgi:diguanylate cyclase (GGDEF)-like protein
MDGLLDSVGDLTDARDKDSLEQSLAAAMFDLLGAARLVLWRLSRQNDAVVLRRRVSLGGSGGESAAHDSGDAAPRSKLDSWPELHACYAARANLRWPAGANGLCRHAFPILDSREPIGILEILRPDALTEEQERLVLGLLRVYRNHLGLLDDTDCDELSGLLNRRTYDETFRKVSTRAFGDDTAGGGFIAVIDIDHFKRINDAFGHPYGDEVIVLLSRLMSAHFQDTHYLFRFGGEEFVVLLDGMTSAEARATLERLRATVESFPFPQVGSVTVSLDFSEIRPGDTGAAAFGRADQALYFSKRNGRNQLFSYEELVAACELVDHTRAADEVELF